MLLGPFESLGLSFFADGGRVGNGFVFRFGILIWFFDGSY